MRNRRFFRGIRPKFTVDEDGRPAVELDFSSPPTTSTLEDVLALPESLHRGGRNVVVVFDEFQEIERLSSVLPAERVFRSVIQRQRHVNYVYLGSRTHLIRRMFTDAAKPFYQSALVLRMDKPPRDESIAFLRERFRRGGIPADDAALDAIIDASTNIPYYLQALAYEAFEAAESEGRRRIRAEDVPTALARAVSRMRDTFETAVENLSENLRTLLSALAREPATGFDSDYRARHRLPRLYLRRERPQGPRLEGPRRVRGKDAPRRQSLLRRLAPRTGLLGRMTGGRARRSTEESG